MVHRPATRLVVAPTDRQWDVDRGLLYPGEAATVLGLKEHCSYRQLQAIWFLGRRCQGQLAWERSRSGSGRLKDIYATPDERKRRWTRFSVVDIACAQVVIRLMGGPEGFGSLYKQRAEAAIDGRRLKSPRPRLEPLSRACERLHQLGVANPLLDVELRKDGDSYKVKIAGVLIDPSTGQALLDEALQTTINILDIYSYDPELRSVLAAQANAPRHTQTKPVPQQLQLWGDLSATEH